MGIFLMRSEESLRDRFPLIFEAEPDWMQCPAGRGGFLAYIYLQEDVDEALIYSFYEYITIFDTTGRVASLAPPVAKMHRARKGGYISLASSP